MKNLTFEEMVEVAKTIIDETYEGRYYTDEGSFRSVIIPVNLPFVIKYSCSDEGDEMCFKEQEIYADACDKKLNSWFAKCYGHFIHNGNYYFLFQKVGHVGLTKAKYSFYEDNVTAYAKKKGLLKFFKEWEINDKHEGNYGQVGNILVLVDYAGY